MLAVATAGAGWWAAQTPPAPDLERATSIAQSSQPAAEEKPFVFVDRPLRVPPPPPPKPKPKPAPPKIDPERQRKKEERRRQREKKPQPVARVTQPAFQLMQTVIESKTRRAYVADKSGAIQVAEENDSLDQLKPAGGKIKKIASGKIVVEFQGRDFSFSTTDGATR